MMPVTFKCRKSGNTVSFSNFMDIESMRKELAYEEVKDAVQTKESEATKTNVIPLEPIWAKKKLGRPKKV